MIFLAFLYEHIYYYLFQFTIINTLIASISREVKSYNTLIYKNLLLFIEFKKLLLKELDTKKAGSNRYKILKVPI